MSSQEVRFDIVTVNRGARAGSLSDRLKGIDPSSNPVAIVRRQLIDSVTWHCISLRRLIEAIDEAEADTTFSQLLTLDAANEVEAYGRPPAMLPRACCCSTRRRSPSPKD